MDLQTLNGEFTKAVHLALKRYHRDKELAQHPLTKLTIVEEVRRQHNWPDTPQGRAAALREAFNRALSLVEARDKEQAELLRCRFWRNESVIKMALKRGMAESTFYSYQERALRAFAFALWELEHSACLIVKKRQHHLQRNLPAPTYTKLFGVDDVLTRLREALTSPKGPWVISIEGLGGLGKTSLAHNLASWTASKGNFADIIWETALHQEFPAEIGPALTAERLLETIAVQLNLHALLEEPSYKREAFLYEILKSTPHLIIVDNLETAADCTVLFPKLQEFANPTRFILTSSYSLSRFPCIFCLTLNELKEADAFALIRYESQLKGIPSLVEADENILRQIYHVTGGNPLAIKLVIGQARFLPLERVIKQLREAGGEQYRGLYQSIYRHSWGLLSEDARKILLAMPSFVFSGASWENLQAVTDLKGERLDAAIEELVEMSLLQVNSFTEKRYSIHRLTYTFIMADLVGDWDGAEAAGKRK